MITTASRYEGRFQFDELVQNFLDSKIPAVMLQPSIALQIVSLLAQMPVDPDLEFNTF